MTVEGISHITLVVRDLERMSALLTAVFDAEEVYASGDASFSLSREKFFLVAGVWIAIMEGPALAERSYNHIAFKIAEQDFEFYRQRLQAAGVSVRQGRSRIPGEGRSLYFYDDDNHLFELHTGTLRQRLDAYAAAIRGHR
jgi:catechol 2,3-dioxygenase-like lactoylglutathione lyase family enzyme